MGGWKGQMIISFSWLFTVCSRFKIATGVCWKKSVGLKWHSYGTSFCSKAPMRWVLVRKKRQTGWIEGTKVDFVFGWSTGCLRGSRPWEECAEKRVWAWNLWGILLKSVKGKTKSGDGIEPNQLIRKVQSC